ncbi:hypothetical protein D3C84_933840 [compost metagenome]
MLQTWVLAELLTHVGTLKFDVRAKRQRVVAVVTFKAELTALFFQEDEVGHVRQEAVLLRNNQRDRNA